MSLTEIMSAMDLTLFPQIGLAIFFVVFLAIVWHTWVRPRTEIDHQARLPLDDGANGGRHG